MTANNSIAKSTDGGTTWSTVVSSHAAPSGGVDLVFNKIAETENGSYRALIIGSTTSGYWVLPPGATDVAVPDPSSNYQASDLRTSAITMLFVDTIRRRRCQSAGQSCRDRPGICRREREGIVGNLLYRQHSDLDSELSVSWDHTGSAGASFSGESGPNDFLKRISPPLEELGWRRSLKRLSCFQSIAMCLPHVA